MVDEMMNGDSPLDALEPEVKDGPLGLPYVKPAGAPDLPGPDSDSMPFDVNDNGDGE